MEVLELHMPLVGEAMGWWDGFKHNSIRAQQFELEYPPFVQSVTLFIPEREVRTLDMHYSPAFLASFVRQYPRLEPFLQQVHDKRRGNLFSAVRLMNPAMQRITRDMLRYDGPVCSLAAFYEGRVTLLLHEVLSRTKQTSTCYPPKKDVDAVMAVRELVQLQPQRVFTSAELGVYTGISVSKLHYTFKELCGTTMFDYSQGVRLDYGRQLLRDTPALVQEVAWECGYTEHANFTAAFRKRFGCSPQEDRSSKIKYRNS